MRTRKRWLRHSRGKSRRHGRASASPARGARRLPVVLPSQRAIAANTVRRTCARKAADAHVPHHRPGPLCRELELRRSIQQLKKEIAQLTRSVENPEAMTLEEDAVVQELVSQRDAIAGEQEATLVAIQRCRVEEEDVQAKITRLEKERSDIVQVSACAVLPVASGTPLQRWEAMDGASVAQCRC